MAERPRRKQDTLLAIWEWVKTNAPDTLEFSNPQVKHISTAQGFSNQFDVVHVDTTRSSLHFSSRRMFS